MACLASTTSSVRQRTIADTSQLYSRTVLRPTPFHLSRRRLTHKATIKASTYTGNKKHRIASLGSYALAKRTWIKFTIETNIREPFEVKWQVVNTGAEALAVNQLRGGFEDSHGQHHRWESVAYAGTHWVEAFVIKNGVCVARSGPKHVKVRH